MLKRVRSSFSDVQEDALVVKTHLRVNQFPRLEGFIGTNKG